MDDIYFALIIVGCTGFLSWSIAHSISKLTSALYEQSDRVVNKLNKIIEVLYKTKL